MSLLLVVSLGAGAQEDESLQTYLREVMTAEDVESSMWEDVYDQLCELSLHPFDLNTATRSQLEDLPFLSAQQIEEIMEYLYRYGPMKSKGELLMIRSLDEARRRLLASVCYVGDAPKASFPRLKEILRDGHHELMATARIPFQKKDDDYLGSPLRHWLRYQFNDGDYVKLGLVGANDAGEPFFADCNRWGYDHYSFYLQLQGLGRLESLCLGHYRVSMGMGLVMNTQTNYGKVAMLQWQCSRCSDALRPPSRPMLHVPTTICKGPLPPCASLSTSHSLVSSPIVRWMPHSIRMDRSLPSSPLPIIAHRVRWRRNTTLKP